MNSNKESDIRRAITNLLHQGFKLKDLLKVCKMMLKEEKDE